MGLLALAVAASSTLLADGASVPTAETKTGPMIESQWKGKKVAYLGDSITDKRHVGTTSNYWQYLDSYLGTEAWGYGINGADWNGVLGQAQKLKAEKGDSVDAIIVFAGTNDYNGGVPLGDWWSTTNQLVECWGKKMEVRARRLPNLNQGTFRGRINVVLDYLKTNFPRQQIILLAPIHRGYATFGGGNIQPEESYPNARGPCAHGPRHRLSAPRLSRRFQITGLCDQAISSHFVAPQTGHLSGCPSATVWPQTGHT